MRIIDPHVHVWKNDPAFPGRRRPPRPPQEDATPEMLLQAMQAHGVEQHGARAGHLLPLG